MTLNRSSQTGTLRSPGWVVRFNDATDESYAAEICDSVQLFNEVLEVHAVAAIIALQNAVSDVERFTSRERGTSFVENVIATSLELLCDCIECLAIPPTWDSKPTATFRCSIVQRRHRPKPNSEEPFCCKRSLFCRNSHLGCGFFDLTDGEWESDQRQGGVLASPESD